MKILTWLLEFWKQKKEFILIAGVAIILFLLTFMKGCQYGKQHKKCPEIVSNTVYLHDTITRTIIDHVPYYVQEVDTVYYPKEIPAKVDTAQILKNYFATFKYDRYWTAKDTLEVYLTDYISQNKSIHNVFKYKWLLPTTITENKVDNSVHYSSYLYLGASVPVSKLDYSSIDLTLALPKFYIGVGYLPGINGFSVKGGVKLISFKK